MLCEVHLVTDEARCMQYFVLTDRRPGAPTTVPQLLDRYADIRPFSGFMAP